MSRTTVLILAVVSAIFLFFALIVVIGSAREKARQAGPSAPPSRRPGPNDEALEGPLLERYQVAGVALTVFLAILLPFLYLREPARQQAAAEKELTESVRLGEATYEEFCMRCHGPGAEHTRDGTYKARAKESCVRCHTPNDDPDFDFDKDWPAVAH